MLDVVYHALLQLASFALAALLTVVVIEELRLPRGMPPSPGRRLPLLGHRLLLPNTKAWLTFRKWNEEHGPIVTFWNGSQPTVLVGSGQIAVDLLEKRSQKYSSRPRFVVGGELLTENKSVLFAPYDERWRAYRRILHGATMPKSVEGYKPIFEAEGKIFTANLLADPDDFYDLIYRYTASSVVAIAYGRRVLDTRTDAACRRLAENNDFLTRVNVPGAQWHETFPALAYLPAALNPIKRTALAYRAAGRANLAHLVGEVRNKMARGAATPSFARGLLEARDRFAELDDVEFNQAPGSLFAAGVDTTSATLQSLVLALAAHRDAQARAHAELDAVVGSARAPAWDDEERLPFVCAVIKETMRWRPVAILGGTSHASTEDDVYEHGGQSYFIPQGSIILGNLWSIHMDKSVYDDPERFMPERFLGGREYAGAGARGHSAFGWGRRVCPGAHFAERSLYLTAARLMWGFTIAPRALLDTSMETGYTAGFNTRPVRFACDVRPRSEKHRETMLREAAEAREELKAFEAPPDE